MRVPQTGEWLGKYLEGCSSRKGKKEGIGKFFGEGARTEERKVHRKRVRSLILKH